MGNEQLGRRQILTAAGAGVAAVATLGGTAGAATPATSDERDGLTGGWLISRHDNGAPGDVRAVITFAAGGAFLALDIDPAAPPLAGSWERDGRNGFVAVFWGSADDGQGHTGTVRVRAVGRHDGNKLSGSYTVHVTVGGFSQKSTGTVHGSRIKAD